MKNKLCAAAFMAALVCTAVSCGDNNSDSVNDNAPIVGKWKYYGDYEADEGELDVDDEDDCYTETIQFKNDGTAKYHETDCDEGYDDSEDFTWQTQNEGYTQIKVTFEDEIDTLFVHYSANKDTLTIQDDQDDLSGEVYLRQ